MCGMVNKQKKRKKNEPHWVYSYDFAETWVAIDCRLYDIWEELPMWKKEKAFAFWKNRREMESWENHLEMERIEKEQKKIKGKK